MNRIKGIIYDAIGLMTRLTAGRSGSKPKLLIVRVDEIGDYMLWRNFLPSFLEAPQFKDHEIHFCGNQSWRSLYLQLDQHPSIQQTWWLDKVRFKKDMRYRYQFLRHIAQQGYTAVINPTFSRDKRYDDSIVKAADAKENWGMEANLESVQQYERGYDKGLYQHLFTHPERPLFEFYRNKLFTAFVIQQTVSVPNTCIAPQSLPVFTNTPQDPFFVVFPGSRSASRIWPTEHFVAVASFLHAQFGLMAVVCGAGSDAPYTRAFCEAYPYPVHDLTGKTSLPEMLTVLSKARLLLSVDTGAVHLATAVGCTVYGIFNGSQYGRFAPYPHEMAPGFHAIYPEAIQEELKDLAVVRSKYEFVVPVPYTLVRAEQVIEIIRQQEVRVISR